MRRFLLVFPAVIAGFGIQNLYVYFTNPKPIEVSLEQLITNPPTSKWVRVTGGQVNLIESAVSQSGFRGFKGKIDSVYVPIHPEGKQKAKVSVLLLSTSPEVIEFVRKLNDLDNAQHGEQEAFRLALMNAQVIFQNRPFEGLIQSGLSKDDRTTFQIRKVLRNVVKDPIIIEEGKKPTLFEGFGILLLAFVSAVGVLAVPLSKGRNPPPLPPSMLPPPLPPIPPRLPRNG